MAGMNSASASKILMGLVAISSVGVAAADPESPGTASPSVETLQKKVDTLSQQLEELKAQLKQLQQRNGVPAPPPVAEQPAKATEPAQANKPEPTQARAEQQAQQPAEQAAPTGLSRWDKVSLWGYGEIYYMRPTKDGSQTTADLARAVFGIGYQFNENTRFNSEFEWEHAVTSADDKGEVEVEQFYVDHTINAWASFQAGLFLIPAGLLNEHHEPTNFYGVQRNFVETLIIPTTWREGGVAFKAVSQNGFTGTVGITTGLDFSKWEFNPATPLYNSAFELISNGVAPMQATHQELSIANAQHLSGFAALNYTGVLGLLVGGSVFTGKAAQALPEIPDNQHATLWEVHGRWTPGKFDLSAVYAHGYFTNTAEANLQFPGATNPLPASFYGYYLQGAYKLWQRNEMSLNPFVRWERYNMGASYSGLTSPVPPPGFPSPNDTVTTIGLNYYLTPQVVFKVDYQHFLVNDTFTRVDLGLGLAF
jgi:hypothetical protein